MLNYVSSDHKVAAVFILYWIAEREPVAGVSVRSVLPFDVVSEQKSYHPFQQVAGSRSPELRWTAAKATPACPRAEMT
jgi:hypothetical protein